MFAYELIVGAPPFKAAQMIDTARNIIHANVSFPDAVSDLARDFISRALHKVRAHAAVCCGCTWMRQQLLAHGVARAPQLDSGSAGVEAAAGVGQGWEWV